MKVDFGLAVRIDKSQQRCRCESDLNGTVSLHCCRESLGRTNLLIFKATMDGETQKRTKMGRPKCHEGLKVVYLMESTFQIWNDRTKELSLEGHVMTSNEFAISKSWFVLVLPGLFS